MSLLRLAAAALAVAAWFAVCAIAARRIRNEQGPLRFRVELVEAALLTLVAALWFASLGHGAWWLLFLVLGLLVEGPVRLRHRAGLPGETGGWRASLLGAIRLVGAGAVLSLLL